MTSGPCAPHHCGQHFNVDNTVVVSKLFSGIGSPFQIWKIWICSCQLTFKISLVGREECFVHRTWFWGNSFIFLTLVLVLSRTLQLVWLLHGSLFPTSFAVIPFGNGFMLSLQTPIFFQDSTDYSYGMTYDFISIFQTTWEAADVNCWVLVMSWDCIWNRAFIMLCLKLRILIAKFCCLLCCPNLFEMSLAVLMSPSLP